MKLEHPLRVITELIVTACDPEVILLFGSYAKQQDRIDSDLDLLVIGPFRQPRHLRGREIEDQLHHYPIHIDLLLYTPEEVALESNKLHSFMQGILASGVILYKKTKDG